MQRIRRQSAAQRCSGLDPELRTLSPPRVAAPARRRPAAKGRRAIVVASLVVALPSVLGASAFGAGDESAVEITVSLAQRAHHEARIAILFPDLPQEPLEVRMSRSSPGRYALHEFAKNVYSVRATDGSGRPLRIERPDAHQWTVHDHDGAVRFEYTLFGDRVDGTYAAIDETHAHLNAPASFAWARGLEDRPVQVTFERPEGWRVATQLAATASPSTWTAPDLQYLMDSPVEVSGHQLVEWRIPGPEGAAESRQLVRLAIHHLGTGAETRAYAKAAAAIVDEQIAIFGAPPRFDFGTYTFLADYLPWASGDGMEHRNSTVLTSSGSLEDRAVRNLGTVAHEFFHAWNIERIRPRSLEPFDFERANVSGELWFGEGFTSYYDDLTLRRAGVVSFERFVDGISDTLSAVIGSPARAYGGPVVMSRQAPFVDAASWIDPSNRSNTFLSYYTYGAVLGLGLDLELRTRFGLALDDYLRAVWEAHGRTGIPYTLEDLERILAQLTDEAAWAAGFFARSIEGSELPDYERLLASAGLLLRHRRPDAAWLGRLDFDFELEARGAALEAPTLVGSPLHAAGFDRGDRILEIDGRPAISRGAFESVLGERRPGDTVSLRVERRGAAAGSAGDDVEVTLARDPEMEVVSFERAGLEVTPEIERFRKDWLGARAHRREELERYCPDDGEAFPFEFEYCPRHGSALRLTTPGSGGADPTRDDAQ
ncbi:MAG TPA: PDZ domain-containing protein [Thermoanaerobaculia bacterium]|nr:PDZ domain-containing protein [Thermoanaerobaculia bacterium]